MPAQHMPSPANPLRALIRPTKIERIIVLVFAVAWCVFLLKYPPLPMGGTDAYLFRDAVCNATTGYGFVTASTEHSVSFIPSLYSNYTPLSQWVFLPEAKLQGCGPASAETSALIWGLLTSIACLLLGWGTLEPGRWRALYTLLVAAILPYAFTAPAEERAEPFSFVLLVLFALALRIRRPLVAWPLAGFLASLCFLSEPFAGVLAFSLLAVHIVFTMPSSPFSRSAVDAGQSKTSPWLAIAATMLAFVLPIAGTAAAFYHQDPQSLQRFYHQATQAGLSRQANYSMSAGASPAADTPPPHRVLGKYRDAISFQWHQGIASRFTYFGPFMTCVILCWLLLLRSTGSRNRVLLFLAASLCIFFPLVVFPLQAFYLLLGAVFLPFLLAIGWSGFQAEETTHHGLTGMVAASLFAALPMTLLFTLMAMESKASIRFARTQAELLAKTLPTLPQGKVVLVPSTHYYLYKDLINPLFNPTYLPNSFQTQDVAAFATCYTSTMAFEPNALTIPESLANRPWTLLSGAHNGSHIHVGHVNVMRSDWSFDCNVYVDPSLIPAK